MKVLGSVIHGVIAAAARALTIVAVELTGNESNVLFNDAISTFYLRLYGKRNMIEVHSDSERGNPLTPFMDYSFR